MELNQAPWIDKARVSFLHEQARQIRLDIIEMCYAAGPERKAHPGPALSSADLVAALFFGVMRIDPANPAWDQRDMFILSKGHAAPVLYAALANKGYFDKSQYRSLRRVGGMLQGHPDMKGTPGVDMTTGSLGHGLSAGMGMAISAKIDQTDRHVFVIMGDGECQEGLVWEAAMSAPKYHLDNLIAIVDNNGYQSCESVSDTIPLDPFKAKWVSFGWNVIEIDGHAMSDILGALELAVHHACQPTVIIAHTTKGKGVSFMENDNSWHQKALTRDQYVAAMTELGGEPGHE
jgi:transketolase